MKRVTLRLLIAPVVSLSGWALSVPLLLEGSTDWRYVPFAFTALMFAVTVGITVRAWRRS